MKESAQADNILYFPKIQEEDTQDPSVIFSRVLAMKKKSIDDALDFLAPTLFEALTTAGFNIDDERKNLLLVELLRAIMSEHYGISNPLNNFILSHSRELDMIIDFNELEKAHS